MIKKLWEKLTDVYPSDRKAMLVLAVLAFFTTAVLILRDAIRQQADNSLYISSAESSSQHNKTSHKEKQSKSASAIAGLQPFDPNEVDSLTLAAYGIAPRKIRTFMNYRRKGKVFHDVRQLADTYGWTDDDVLMLAPHVVISEKYLYKSRNTDSRNHSNYNQAKGYQTGNINKTYIQPSDNRQSSPSSTYSSNKFKSPTKVDLNRADTTELMRIPGIGHTIANNIVRERTRLGAFHSVEQLMRVRYFSEELLPWFYVNSSDVQKNLNINTASFQALNSHPYISYEQTRSILQYRHNHGAFTDATTLISTGIFTKEQLQLLLPYLTF